MKNQILAVIVSVITGCGSTMSGAGGGGQGGTGGTGGTGGSPSGNDAAGLGSAGADASTPAAPAQCLERPAARTGTGARVTVNVALSYSGTSVTFGEPFAIDSGTQTLTNFRFYVSDVALRLRSGENVPVDLVQDQGEPVPYGVVLVNAEDSSGMAFQIAAPDGDYSGLSFLVGIPDVCNTADYGRTPPLSAASQMTWPAPFGYLFLRYAATESLDGEVPAAIDMGGFPGHIFAPRIEAASDLKVEGAQTVRLTVALDQLLRAARMPATLDDYAQFLGSVPGPLGTAQINGQHVLQNLGAVAAFTLTDLP